MTLQGCVKYIWRGGDEVIHGANRGNSNCGGSWLLKMTAKELVVRDDRETAEGESEGGQQH